MWVAIITALIVSITGGIVTVMTTGFNMWMSYKSSQLQREASEKVEKVRVELEKKTISDIEAAKVNMESTKLAQEKLEKISEVTDKTYLETNHNYQVMQKQLAASQETLAYESERNRDALAASNEELQRANKEIAAMVKSLALMSAKKAEGVKEPVNTADGDIKEVVRKDPEEELSEDVDMLDEEEEPEAEV